jgi:serine/threonine protein kinase
LLLLVKYLYLTLFKKLVDSVFKEILVLTNERLRQNANVLHLLFYDLITQDDKYVVPVLIVERARYGSLAEYLERQEGLEAGRDKFPSADEASFTPVEKSSICADITRGLLALHKAGIAHGDVKSDNVLLFDSSQPEIRFQAKLSDFGSILMLDQPRSNRSPKYLGTRSCNAPEVELQSEHHYLDSQSIIRCDAYSLGLVMMHVVRETKPIELFSKGKDVLGKALELLKQSLLPEQFKESIKKAITILLEWDPNERCSDLSIVLELLWRNEGSTLDSQR